MLKKYKYKIIFDAIEMLEPSSSFLQLFHLFIQEIILAKWIKLIKSSCLFDKDIQVLLFLRERERE